MDYSGIKTRRENELPSAGEASSFKECFYRERCRRDRLPIRIIIRTDLELRHWLAGRKIFVPTNWRNILEEFDRDTMEYDWAANVLPLPCDQRYGAEEMQYIADSIREWEETES